MSVDQSLTFRFNGIITSSGKSIMKWNRTLISLASILFLPLSLSNMLADPRPFMKKQPNGEWIPLKFNGDAHFHYYTDEHGFTVLEDNGYAVYAMLNETSGELESTGRRVGKIDPKTLGLSPKILPDKKNIIANCGEFCNSTLESQRDNGGRNLLQIMSSGTLKNLVIMMCFSDHSTSNLPTQGDLDILFNSEGNNLKNEKGALIAKTGSVRNVLLESSYGKLSLDSKVFQWIKLSKPQKYYTNSNSGLSSRLHEAMKEAMDIVDSSGFDWLSFDQNNDGFIDAITFLHSGYGAEFGGVDCNNQAVNDRVWSHKWSMENWNSRSINNRKVSVSRYHISPARWGTCGDSITRVGVIAHETGHYLGLDDHYDGSVGTGIGNYGLMGNAWGFDFSQEYPPSMSPYCKIKLGWLIPKEISESGIYEIPASNNEPFIYMIKEGFQEGEYLLIENRQPIGYDQKMTQGGLLIWHIDTNAKVDSEGYPGQDGWPHNGAHYKIALLQADGEYDLEQGRDYGDSKDPFHKGGVHSIGPSGTSDGKRFPNTDSYAGGNVTPSGYKISEISESGKVMSFRLTKDDNFSKELETTFVGGNGQAGNMFDVYIKSDLCVYSMDIHTSKTENIDIEIWSKAGTWEGYDKNEEKWTYRGKVNVTGRGSGSKTPVDGFDEICMVGGRTYAIYVTSTDRDIVYSNGKGVGQSVASDQNISIKDGIGKKYKFRGFIEPRTWNGKLRYRLSEATSSGR